MSPTNKNKVLIIASHYFSLINFREDLIKDLISDNFEVYTLAPNIPADFIDKIESLGAKPISVNLQRLGLNPFKDLASIRQLYRIIKDYKIDLVFPYTIKPVIYGSIASRLAGTKTVSMITGLGFTFSQISSKAKLLQNVSEFLYRIALKKNDQIIFQNNDDCQLFLNRKIISNSKNVTIINGSGVNLENFKFRRNYKETQNIKFVFVARLIFSKGIELFLESAKKLKTSYPEAEFHILGPESNEADGLDINIVKKLHEQGIVNYHGSQSNVLHYLTKSDVFVLPSFYREGVPRSILEALSVGMPIITTDMPGCRETVNNDLNGLIIEPRNFDSLMNAMKYFLDNPNRIGPMGEESRKLAENKFDVSLINNTIRNIFHKTLSEN